MGNVVVGVAEMLETNVTSLDNVSMAGNYKAQALKEGVKLKAELKLHKLSMRAKQQKKDMKEGKYKQTGKKKSKSKSKKSNKLQF